MGEDGMERRGVLINFPTEKVVKTLSQTIQLWQQRLRRETDAASAKIPYEPTLDEVQEFALELIKETHTCDQQAAVAKQSRLMRPDKAGGERKVSGDFKRALLNLTERDTDIYCRAIALAFLQLKAADERVTENRREKISQACLDGLYEVDDELEVGPVAAKQFAERFLADQQVSQAAQAIAPLFAQVHVIQLCRLLKQERTQAPRDEDQPFDLAAANAYFLGIERLIRSFNPYIEDEKREDWVGLTPEYEAYEIPALETALLRATVPGSTVSNIMQMIAIAVVLRKKRTGVDY